MKILITGSSGTIGTRLCEKLLRTPHEISGADKVTNRWSQDVGNITSVVDLLNQEAMHDILPINLDLIIHLAANARVHDLVQEPKGAMENIETTFNILEYARQHDIPRLIFASSRECYGNSAKKVLSESDVDIENCESPYSASKIAGEVLVNSYERCYGLFSTILRFSNVYGMYDDSDRVIPVFIRRCLDNEELTIYGEDKLLDFTYIDDTISGIMCAVRNPEKSNTKVYNIAHGRGTSLLHLAELIKHKTDSKSKINLADSRTGEVISYVANINKAAIELGYTPKTGIEEGLSKSIRWYKRNF